MMSLNSLEKPVKIDCLKKLGSQWKPGVRPNHGIRSAMRTYGGLTQTFLRWFCPLKNQTWRKRFQAMVTPTNQTCLNLLPVIPTGFHSSIQLNLNVLYRF